MNNLTKYLISFALLCLSNVAISETIEFSINCEILDQVILEAADGKSKRYSSIEGKEKVGDRYSVSFSFTTYTKGYTLQITSLNMVTYFGSAHSMAVPSINLVTFRNRRGSGGLSEEHFSFRDNNQLSAQRYYKNDWSALVTDSGGSRIMALNCMSVPADYDQMLQKMVDYHKANPAKPK
jgi:hypothetical protein